MADSASMYVPPQLVHSKLKLQKLIRARQQRRFFPINGKNGYGSAANNEIEFRISTDDLIDPQTMYVSFDLSLNNRLSVVDDVISSLVKEVEVYFGDKPLERIQDFGFVQNAMIYNTSNTSYYENELSVLSGAYKLTNEIRNITATNQATADAQANPAAIDVNIDRAGHRGSGKFIMPLESLGLARIRTLLPVFQNNLRIILKLARPQDCMSANADHYAMDNVSFCCDTITVDEGYRATLLSAIQSEAGFTIPIQTFSVIERSLQAGPLQLINIPGLSYAEIDSVFFAVKRPNQPPTSACPLPEFERLKVEMGGKDLTFTDGQEGHPEAFAELRKAFAGLHDATGHCLLNYDEYTKEFTLMGINCEKTIGDHSVLRSGINGREFSYTMNVRLETDPLKPLTNNDKMFIMVLHRKLLQFRSGAIDVAE